MIWPLNLGRSSTIENDVWEDVIDAVAWHTHLNAEEVESWRQLTATILRRKRVVPIEDYQLEESQRVLVAALVALPVLHMGADWYRGWHEILVYPGAFRQRYEFEDDAGVVHSTQRTLSGEAWDRGPMVLSWNDLLTDLEDPEAGSSVAIHECAHKLDLLRGQEDNGFPPLHADMDSEAWTTAFADGYKDLCDRLEDHQPVAVDPYAAESPGEFFAVMSEHFFVVPTILHETWPAIYGQLREFYRQDPLRPPRAHSA